MRFWFIILFCISNVCSGQNIFAVHNEHCKAGKFCMDCGTVKAGVDKKKFRHLIRKLNKENYLPDMSGTIRMQVLIDSLGSGCVLSHTDMQQWPITIEIVNSLNAFDGYIVAEESGIKESLTSIELKFTLYNGVISGNVKRFNTEEFEAWIAQPKRPQIFNLKYQYDNPHLKNYSFDVYNKPDTKLPNLDISQIELGENGKLYVLSNGQIMEWDNGRAKSLKLDFSDNATGEFIQQFCISSTNRVWAKILSSLFTTEKFHPALAQLDSILKPDAQVTFLLSSRNHSKVLIGGMGCLYVIDTTSAKLIHTDTLCTTDKDYILFADFDSNGRLWVGTQNGSFMLNQNLEMTCFQKNGSLLAGKAITSMAEDEIGNLYFSIYEFGVKGVNKNEGIVVMDSTGTFSQFTASNSGMPYNHVTDVVYDNSEKVLWIATDRAGLVRYDLNGNWENYHSDNSPMPSSQINDLSMDKNGSLILATQFGLVIMTAH